MKAKAQHNHAPKATILTTSPRSQNTQISLDTLKNQHTPIKVPIQLHNSPSQFSSATTPIKQLRLSSVRCGTIVPTTSAIGTTRIYSSKPTGYRNYNMNKIPISKVTVSTLYNRPSILRNSQNKKFMTSRNKPYSTSTRTLDFNALVNQNTPSPPLNLYNLNSQKGNPYELRPRRNINMPSRFDPAMHLLPNSNLSRTPITGSKSSTNISTRL